MAQKSFNFDERTEQLLESLKQHFRASSQAEVVRKALALLELAKRAEEQGGGLAVVDAEDHQPKRIKVL